jgi:hypothetical protein
MRMGRLGDVETRVDIRGVGGAIVAFEKLKSERTEAVQTVEVCRICLRRIASWLRLINHTIQTLQSTAITSIVSHSLLHAELV